MSLYHPHERFGSLKKADFNQAVILQSTAEEDSDIVEETVATLLKSENKSKVI